jgi:hypothetical protein
MTTSRIDRATAAFRAGERDLHTVDGQKLYSDEEHERRVESLLETFNREADAAIAEADRIVERAEHTLALEHRDLSDSLTTAELERANAKKSYVEDDVRDLPLDKLVQRVKAAKVAGDKPTMFLYARTLERRVETEYEDGNVDERNAKAVRELEELAGELTQTVRGEEAVRALEEASKAKRDAISLKLYAEEARRKVDGTEDRQYREAVERHRTLL